MGKKLNFEEVEEVFNCRGLFLITREYKNSKTKMEYICEKGHKGSTTVSSIKDQETGCRECTKEMLREKFKLPFEDVKKSFKNNGYELISTEYENAHQKLTYICDKGHIEEMNYANFRSGRRCPVCAGKEKYSYEFIKKEFEIRGYTLLSKEYLNKSSKLSFICDNGHISEISYNSFSKGASCGSCAGNLKPTFEEVRGTFENRGFKLVSNQYQNNRSPLEFICPNGHKGNILFVSFKQGGGCRTCNLSKENNPRWKGGISPLHKYLRYHIKEWKIHSFVKHKRKCVITGRNADVVHHLYSFSNILLETLIACDLKIEEDISKYTESELRKLVDACIEIHHKYGLGVPLSSDIHKLFHKLYGWGNNTPEQFEEFQIRWCAGEFKNPIC
jgi:hypothetical protein